MEKKKIRIGLIPKLIIAIILGILFGSFMPEWFNRVVVTFSSIFSTFLSFVIPLMIVAYVTMGIANLRSGAGKLLIITVALSYFSTLVAGSASYLVASNLFPSFMSEGALDQTAATAEVSLSGYFSLSIYPPSVPVNLELIQNGVQQSLLQAGALFKPCFCGPCFGAGDVPANNALSVRHTTRNFPNREGSKPGDGQLSGVLLMDARSIAATARNHGVVTSAADVDYPAPAPVRRTFDGEIYGRRVYFGYGKARPEAPLHYGPNIAEWPAIPPLGEELLLQVASVLRDPVTTTDELIPSGETSSYRSNPLKLASFALSRRDPDYVPRARATQALEEARRSGAIPPELQSVQKALSIPDMGRVQIGSVLFANKPGDGSAREQAASCQKVLGGFANICYEFATKRYRSNCINWGILPFTLDAGTSFDYAPGDCVFVPGIRQAIENGIEDIPARVIRTDGAVEDLMLHVKGLTDDEKEIILDGCLMNYYAKRN